MKKVQKRMTVVLAGAAAAMGFGITAGAELPEDFWGYETAYDEENNLIYTFDELEIVIPEEWEDRYEIEEADDGLRFYSTAVREYGNETYPGWKGGELFTLHATQDYDFIDKLQYSYIIGTSETYIYHLSRMQEEAFDPEDKESAKEWNDLMNDLEWIEEETVVTDEAECRYAVMCAADVVNIRSEATTKSTISGIVPSGQSVKVEGSILNGWIPVEYQGIQGYIRQDLLKETIPASASNSSANSNAAQAAGNDQTEGGNSTDSAASGSEDYSALLSSGGTVFGTILSKDESSGVQIQTDSGSTCYFRFGKWTTNSFGEVGDYVEVQYMGDLSGEPQVQSMVKKTAPEEADSAVRSVEGTVTFEGNDTLTIQTADGASYSFVVGGRAFLDEVSIGDAVEVSYRGKLDAPQIISVTK